MHDLNRAKTESQHREEVTHYQANCKSLNLFATGAVLDDTATTHGIDRNTASYTVHHVAEVLCDMNLQQTWRGLLPEISLTKNYLVEIIADHIEVLECKTTDH